MKQTETDTELLTTAIEQGYFRIPRQTTLVDLADERGISDAEASKRLRTGIAVALGDYLDAVEAPVVPEDGN
jgi:predicted DNA binding protein